MHTASYAAAHEHLFFNMALQMQFQPTKSFAKNYILSLWKIIRISSYQKLYMKFFILTGIVASFITAFIFFKPTLRYSKKSSKIIVTKATTATKTDADEILRLNEYAKKISSFVVNNKFNEEYCFLADMQIPSGKKRFFVYSLKGDSVLDAGLVTHGSGSQTATENLQFSNIPNSLATSLGKYKVGAEYMGKFGLAYKLIGLDKTNSNAYARVVVLHAHPLVPAQEVSPHYICTSWGCPTVNPSFLLVLQKYIHKSVKPVMLYIFY